MDISTREGRAELRKLCEAATPADGWHMDPLRHVWRKFTDNQGRRNHRPIAEICAVIGAPESETKANGLLFVAARAALPAALSLLDEREAEIERLSRERDGLRADLTAGRELMRQAWDIFNAIRARDGAPEGWDHGYWNDLTESLEALLGDVAKPWMTAAAQELIKPIERERDAAQNEAAAHLEEIEHLKAQRDMHAHACDIAQAERDRAQTALREAEAEFRRYAYLHEAKGDDEVARSKALANHRMADRMRAALSPAPPAEHYEPTRRPEGSNADEWAVFLEEHRDATAYVAVQIAEAIDSAALRRTP